jgi:ribosomal protein S18 acetylase RimI-like enzyme
MRTLKSDQLEEIREIAEQCFVELKQSGKRFDFDHFRWAVGQALDEEQMVLWVTGWPVDGFLLVNFAPDLFAGELTGYSISWFVKPERRKQGIANSLWRKFFEEGDRRDCRHFIFGHPFVVNEDGNSLWFEKRGFKKVENLYRFDV